MSIVVSNSTNGTFDTATRRPELYVVAAGSYADDLHGVGAAASDSYLPLQNTSLSGTSFLQYTKVGKVVLVHGYIILDLSLASPVTANTQEVRIRVQTPSADEPSAWGVQLPLPAHCSRPAGDTESPGGSQPLLDVTIYDENDVRADGTAASAGNTNLGYMKARPLADGTLALVVLGIANSGGTPIQPMTQAVVTSAGFASAVTNAGGFSQADGSLLKLVVSGHYMCQ